MYKKIPDENILNGSNFSIFVGIPIVREHATGTIDGSNKDFKVKGPIYPKNSLSILPIVGDVTADTKKTITWTPGVAVAAVKAGIDTATGDTIYNTVEMAAAPASATVDGVYVNYVEELQAMLNQGQDTTFDQEKTEVTYCGSNNTLISVGSISTSFKVDLKVTESTLRQMQQMSWEKMESQEGVDTGMTAFSPFTQPQSLYAYVNVKDANGDVIGRLYCESVKVPPTFPTYKTGDDASISLELTVGKVPTLILADAI